MRADPLYRNAYPRSGDLAVLCEGDLLAYEALVLTKWCDARCDIWPCGTKTAIYGYSDAIGRARPVVAMEDRDFRSVEQAQRDCDRARRDRERRAVKVVAWRCWRRNEIENYLLDPSVCGPVFADWFECSEGDVQAALAEVLLALAVYQAAQLAFSEALQTWQQVDANEALRDNVSCRPTWADPTGLVAADAASVRERLEKNQDGWRPRAGRTSETVDAVAVFESAYERWRDMRLESDRWRADWAGKEVLKYLRMLLAARFGWLDGSGVRAPVGWGALRRVEQDDKDRAIERALAPELVDVLISRLSEDGDDEDRLEWRQVAEDCRSGL